MSRYRRRNLGLARKVGARMREVRLARGLSLVQLHARGAPTPSQMSSIERGKIDFKVDTICDVARALGVRPWQLLTSDDELGSLDAGEAKQILSDNPEFVLPEPAEPIPKAKPWHRKRKGGGITAPRKR